MRPESRDVINIIISLIFVVLFFITAKKRGNHAWGWAIIGFFSYMVPARLLWVLAYLTAFRTGRYFFGVRVQALPIICYPDVFVCSILAFIIVVLIRSKLLSN